jgi:hypothetical protein
MSGLPFKAKFMRTLQNGPLTKVDMWMLRDDRDGALIVTLGVPHGEQDLPYRVCRLLNADASPTPQEEKA